MDAVSTGLVPAAPAGRCPLGSCATHARPLHSVIADRPKFV